jgi:hypothetical protein
MLVVFLRAVKSAQKPQLAAAAVQVEGGTGKAIAAVGSGAGAVAGAAMGLRSGGDESQLDGGEAADLLGAGIPLSELPAANPAELEERRVRAIDLASKDPVGAAIILTRWLSSPESAAAQVSERGAE